MAAPAAPAHAAQSEQAENVTNEEMLERQLQNMMLMFQKNYGDIDEEAK